jgi:hypothetical protein
VVISVRRPRSPALCHAVSAGRAHARAADRATARARRSARHVLLPQALHRHGHRVSRVSVQLRGWIFQQQPCCVIVYFAYYFGYYDGCMRRFLLKLRNSILNSHASHLSFSLFVIRVPTPCDAHLCISVFCPSTTMLRCSTCGTSFPPKALVAKQRPTAAASQLPLGAGASA